MTSENSDDEESEDVAYRHPSGPGRGAVGELQLDEVRHRIQGSDNALGVTDEQIKAWEEADEDIVCIERLNAMTADSEEGPKTLDEQDNVDPELMGKVQRHPITSKISLLGCGQEFDFDFVDLSKRSRVTGKRAEVANDKYLFKPVVLKYRTWIWHDIYRGLSEKGLVSKSPGQGIWHAITITCFDEFSDAGLWSPTIVFAPMLILVMLTMDAILCLLSLVLVCGLLLITVATNSAEWYYLNRLVSLPPRVIYAGVLVWRIAVSEQVIGQLAAVLLFLCMIADFAMGDLMQLNQVRRRTTYTVLRVLPDQVAVCIKQRGDEERPHYKIDRNLTGFAGVDDIVILANAMGVLVELVPLTPEDVTSFVLAKDKPLKFVGLDVYDGSKNEDINELDPDGLTIYPQDLMKVGGDWEDPINLDLRNYLAYVLDMPWKKWLEGRDELKEQLGLADPAQVTAEKEKEVT